VLGKIIISQHTSNKCFIGFYVMVKTIGEQYITSLFFWSKIFVWYICCDYHEAKEGSFNPELFNPQMPK